MIRKIAIAVFVLPFALTSCKMAPEEPKTLPMADLAPAAGVAPGKTLIRKPKADLGILLGAWASPEINASMNDLDRVKNQQAEKRVTNAPSGQMVTWISPSTGNSGTIVAVRDAYDSSGSFCREFRQTVTVEGIQKQGRSIACQQQDGSWKAMPQYAGG